MYSNHTFLDVLSNPLALLVVPTRSGYVPSRSTNEFENKQYFSYVPAIAKAYRRTKTMAADSTVSQKNAGGLNAHTHMICDI